MSPEPARDSDLDACAAIMAGTDPWITLGRDLAACRRTVRLPDLNCYVLRQDDVVSAFVLVHPRGLAGAPYVWSLAVREVMRGQGLGTRLLSYVEEVYAGHTRAIYMCVSSFNPNARRLYERLGWQAVGELPQHIIDDASEILLQKQIRRPTPWG